MDTYKRPEHIELTADQSRDQTLLSKYSRISNNRGPWLMDKRVGLPVLEIKIIV